MIPSREVTAKSWSSKTSIVAAIAAVAAVGIASSRDATIRLQAANITTLAVLLAHVDCKATAFNTGTASRAVSGSANDATHRGCLLR